MRETTAYEGDAAALKPGARVTIWYRNIGERYLVADRVGVLTREPVKFILDHLVDQKPGATVSPPTVRSRSWCEMMAPISRTSRLSDDVRPVTLRKRALGELLVMDARVRHLQRAQRRCHRDHHRRRSADEGLTILHIGNEPREHRSVDSAAFVPASRVG